MRQFRTILWGSGKLYGSWEWYNHTTPKALKHDIWDITNRLSAEEWHTVKPRAKTVHRWGWQTQRHVKTLGNEWALSKLKLHMGNP